MTSEAEKEGTPRPRPAAAASALEKKEAVHRAASDESDEFYSAGEEEDNASLQDALASSAALVGENVLDSPSSNNSSDKNKHRSRRPADSTSAVHAAMNAPPPLAALDESDAARITTSASSVQQTTTTLPSLTTTTPSSPITIAASSSALDEESVGVMAAGIAWVHRQRDQRRRLYLQNQAEQQLRKIRAAQAAEQMAVPNHRGLSDNSTFASLATTVKSSFGKNQDEDGEDYNNTTATTAAAAGSTAQQRLKTDREFAHEQAACVSKSGDGYSGQLQVEEDPKEEDAGWIPTVRLDPEPDTDQTPFILNQEMMQQIAIDVLPRGIAYCRWKRLYSLARDGDSFDACLRLIGKSARTLTVVRTARNDMFGGFADTAWDSQSHGSAVYFGGPQACLFSIVPKDNAADKEERDAVVTLKYYKWTGANRYIQLVDYTHKMLAFGGGGEAGAFGLCIEKDFQRGSTGHCETFDNEPLCNQEQFEIVDMEIFGFMVGQF